MERRHQQLSELEQQAVGVSTQTSVEVVIPEVVVTMETTEEAALLRQQEQAQADLINRQQQEQKDLQNRYDYYVVPCYEFGCDVGTLVLLIVHIV